jgi:hypothetical protein
MPRKTILFTAFVLAILALILAGDGDGPVIAGTATPNVAGTWEGSWSHRIGSGQITLRLAQEGTKVTGRQSVVGVMPVFETEQSYSLGQDIQDGTLENSTLIFHVRTQNAQTSSRFCGSSSLLVIQVHGRKIATSEERVADWKILVNQWRNEHSLRD